MQLDEKDRGFSFSKEGPLDMRMDPSTTLTAKKIVNQWSEKELGVIFREYGEEPRWRQAAKGIVNRRKKKPIETTKELADTVVDSIGRGKKKRLHPATLVFQALRMCVNRELESIQKGISEALKHLAPGGKIGAMSFHRLEDKIVKELFKGAAAPVKKIEGEKEIHYLPLVDILTKKPVVPSKEETKTNPRSRSAKLRFAQRL